MRDHARLPKRPENGPGPATHATNEEDFVMFVHDIMTADPACCTPDTSMKEAAKMMASRDCGELPVLDEIGRPIGVVTDRDICCRGVAEGASPDTRVREIMSRPPITINPDATLAECCDLLENHQIRRVPVVDGDGRCCGMISQADIARHASPEQIAEVLHDVSQPKH